MFAAVQSESAFQAFIENAPDGFVLLDPVRRASGPMVCFSVRWLNDAAIRLLGQPREFFLGRPVHEVFAGRGGQELLALCRRVSETARPEAGESDHCLGGSSRNLRIAATAVGGGVVGLMLTDVSPARAAHEELLAAGRCKDDFLALVSHELRNPLAGIAYSLEVLAAREGPQSDEETLAMTIATRQLAQLQRLLDDLLDVSRIQRGVISFQPCAMDLADAADQAAQMLRPRFERAGVRVVTAFPGEAVVVHADRARVVQAVGNLLDNACKASSRGASVELGVRARDGFATVVVRDEGCGIARDELDALFDGTGDRGRTRRGGRQTGLGLGLFLTRYLTEAQGGTVSAASEGLRRGATFELTLPLHDRAADGRVLGIDTGGAPVVAPAESLCVLLVDDDADAVDSLRVLFESHGHEVIRADSAEAGLAAVQDRVPDVVLVDIGLPGIGGHQLVRRLRQMPALAHVPMIALSGFGQPSDLQSSHEAGLDAHLVKPVAFNDLTTVIGRALRRDRPSSHS